MKKILLFIVGLLFLGTSFAYDVIIYDENNNVLMMYPVEQGTTEITLDGDWSKNGDNYTFNGGYNGTDVYYVDGYGNNQEVNIKNDLYLNGNLTFGYTGEQYLIFTDEKCGVFNGYIPTFDITGEIQDVSTSGNVFNNFAENSLKVLLSNIPSYIQYVIIILILLFVLGFIKKIRRRR